MQLWAAVDLWNGQVVRMREGRPEALTVYSQEPVRTAQRWAREGADGLHIVDLNRAMGRGNNLPLIRAIVRQVQLPTECGGGVRSTAAAAELWDEGVQRVIFGTLAYREPLTLQNLLQRRGAERCMVAVDHRDGQVMVDGWRQPAQLDLTHAMTQFAQMGVRWFLVTAIHRDGLLQGPDIQHLEAARSRVDAQIMASGGVASVPDLERLRATGVEGVVLGTALYEGRVQLTEGKARLAA